MGLGFRAFGEFNGSCQGYYAAGGLLEIYGFIAVGICEVSGFRKF